MNKSSAFVQVIFMPFGRGATGLRILRNQAAGSPGSLVRENIRFKDQTIEELRATPVEKFKVYQPAGDALSERRCEADQNYGDSIPVLIFNPAKRAISPSLLITTAEDLSLALIRHWSLPIGRTRRPMAPSCLRLIARLRRNINSRPLSMMVMRRSSGSRHMEPNSAAIPAAHRIDEAAVQEPTRRR